MRWPGRARNAIPHDRWPTDRHWPVGDLSTRYLARPKFYPSTDDVSEVFMALESQEVNHDEDLRSKCRH